MIVHTTQRTVWTPKVEVDSVTSASLRKKDEILALAEDLCGRILKIIHEDFFRIYLASFYPAFSGRTGHPLFSGETGTAWSNPIPCP